MTQPTPTSADVYKEQRDQYVAYALAAADLLIEVDKRWNVIETIGATKSLLRHLNAGIKGLVVTELFAEEDRGTVRRLLNRVRSTGRLDLTRIGLEQGDKQDVFVHMGACFLNDPKGSTYITLTVLPAEISQADLKRDTDTHLFDAESFSSFTRQALSNDGGSGQAAKQLQLVKLSGFQAALSTLNEPEAKSFSAEVGSLLRSQSVSGMAAGRLGKDEFGLITAAGSKQFSEGDLTRDIMEAAKGAGIAPGKLKPSVINVNLATGNLNGDSVTKALAYVVNNFSQGQDVPSTLEEGLTLAMDETVETLARVRDVLDNDRFSLHYQPVVELKNRQTHHFEALMRFDDGRNPYDTIRFSERVGLVQDFDLAVIRKAIDILGEHPQISVAVNVSGGSLQNTPFCDALKKLLAPHKTLSKRLMVEITESHAIEDVTMAGNILGWLRKEGFQTCLDDFGAGAAAYNYLRSFDVDFLKIDGEFLKSAMSNNRQRALVRSIVTLCDELGIKVVGEMIETEALAVMALKLGITYGQGWLFGRPIKSIPELLAMSDTPAAARRKGATESWG